MSATAHTDSGGGTVILVRRGIVDHSVPLPSLTHMEATAILVTLPGRTVKILAVYLSPSRLMIGADLTVCFSGGLKVLMAGNKGTGTRGSPRDGGNSYAIIPTETPV
jgi:hypothetical protein